MLTITTWNINGFRAILTKGFRDWVDSQKADILCLQEIKAKPEQVLVEERNIPPYSGVWNSAERPGYSGVACYYLKEPLGIKHGLEETRFNDEGRVLRLEYPDVIVYNIYFPNGQRGQERVDYKLDFYRSLIEECDRLHSANKKIIITGDFNTAHNEIDLANPKENQNTSGFLIEERLMIDEVLNHGFADIYRVLYPTRVQYTWWTYRFNARLRNIGWRLDYFLISESLVPYAKEIVIHDEVMGSDHCPVTLVMDI